MTEQSSTETVGDPPTRRSYRSPARAHASLETRQRVRSAAENLFLRDGYFRTTTKAIAKSAGVSEMTVFNAFSSKAALLSEVIRVRVRGDDHDTPMASREVWREMLAAPPDQILTRFADLNGQILERTAVILALAESAAPSDPELAARRDSSRAHVRSDFQLIADALATHQHLAPSLTPRRAADAIYALADHTTYLRLTTECGWRTTEYVTWLATTLTTALTPPKSQF